MRNKLLFYNDRECYLKDFYKETLLTLKPYDLRYLSNEIKLSQHEFSKRKNSFDTNINYNKYFNILALKNYYKYVISTNYKNDNILFFIHQDKIVLAKENLKIIVVFHLFKNIIGNRFAHLDDSIFYYGDDYNIYYDDYKGYLYLKNDKMFSKTKIFSNNSKLRTIYNITEIENKEYNLVKYKKTNEETVFFGDKDYYINGFNNIIPEGTQMKLYTHLPFVVYETPDYTAFFSR